MNIIDIILLIGLCISIIFSLGLIYQVYKNKRNFPTTSLFILTIMIAILLGILYSSLYVLSITFFFSQSINLFLWKLANIIHFIFLGNGLLIIKFSQKNEIPTPTIIFLTILIGFLIGTLHISNSISFSFSSSGINYQYSFFSQLINVFICISYIGLFLYQTLINFYFKRRRIPKQMVVFYIFFLGPMIAYILYITYFIPILKYIHIIFAWSIYIVLNTIMLKMPYPFLNVSNKVYFINIYHKSGILLFSYHFDKVNNIDNSTIWGQILIGINHILSEFIEKEDKIDMLKIKDSEIAVKYVDAYGFAILVFTDDKNLILEKIINEFTEEFIKKYKNELIELSDLNKLINVSEFSETLTLVRKYFNLYLNHH